MTFLHHHVNPKDNSIKFYVPNRSKIVNVLIENIDLKDKYGLDTYIKNEYI